MENLDGFLPILIDSPVYLIPDNISSTSRSDILVTEHAQNDQNETDESALKSKEEKDVIIVCSSINEKEMEFLVKILSAVKISKSQAYFTDQYIPEDIISKAHIFFGRHTDSGIGEMYKVIKQGGKQILSADALSELEKNVSKKKQLWTELQKMFS